MNFCSNCGAPATGSAFCGNCGSPMAATAEAGAGRTQAGAPPSGQPGTRQSGPIGAGTPGAGTPGAAGRGTNPFADIPALDYVRDIVALVLLLVSFGMPWDLSDTVTGKVYVILVTLLSVISLALPYLQRGGVLPGSWGTAELRLARLAANAPYVVVVLITLILGYVGENGGDGVGVGLMFGLAGALLAAQGRQAEQTPSDGGDGALWRWIALGIGALFALLTVISLVTFLTDDADVLEWEQVTYLVVSMLFFLALAALPLWGVFRGDAAWRDVLVLLGITALFVGVWQLGADGTMADAWSLSTFGPQLILIPAIAVAAAAPGLRTRYTHQTGAAYWPAVSVRALELVMLTAAAGVVFYILQIIGTDVGRGISIVVLVLMLVLVLAALVGRNALVRDGNAGRAIAVVVGGVFILLGIVIAAILGAADETVIAIADATILSVLWVFGLALFLMLTVPSSVRSEYGPIGANQLSLSSVLPGNGPGDSSEPERAERPAGAGVAAGAAAAATGAAATRAAESKADAKAREDAARSDAARSDAAKAEADAKARVDESHAAADARFAEARADADAAKADGDVPASPAVPADEVRTATDAPAGGSGTGNGTAATPSGRIGGDGPGPISGLAADDTAADDTATRVDQPRVEPATRVDQPPVTDAPGTSGFDARTALDPNTPLQVLADIAAQEPGLRKYVAANPSTYPELLTWLSQLGDPEVDEALRRRSSR
ncbi:zinc ribbon domain-containing protein [Jiangella ureilytica]|uniref:Zinc ribbon domain-containing protein n=1 Tax=Jiangella ureilytica TaxID=2530374 RepID=A0A4R4RD90_9ACTN|nr:zinc ribbon domain-containing protein [Jiangella ureilytica]TDC47258.1 zinc ribbon domain-containing protein [Jiangella ureilytica]